MVHSVGINNTTWRFDINITEIAYYRCNAFNGVGAIGRSREILLKISCKFEDIYDRHGEIFKDTSNRRDLFVTKTFPTVASSQTFQSVGAPGAQRSAGGAHLFRRFGDAKRFAVGISASGPTVGP